MIPGATDLRLDDRLKVVGEHHVSLLHRGEGRLLAAAFAGAVVIHVAAALFPIRGPAGSTEPPRARPREPRPAAAQAIVPAPPALSRRVPPAISEPPAAAQTTTAIAVARPVPSPQPLPDLVEPLAEPEPEMAPDDLPQDAEILLGVPEPPPAGPLPGPVEVASDPELIPESRVLPVFPQRARRLGVSGNVVMDVAVLSDGSVGEVTVLRCTPPDVGFCQSAVRAVKRWRYRPGTRDGRPARTSVTVKVDFVP